MGVVIMVVLVYCRCFYWAKT